MVIGIPVFAVIYTYLCRAVNSRLRKKGYSTDLSRYSTDSYGGSEIKTNTDKDLKGEK